MNEWKVQVLQLPHIKLLTSSSLVCETATSLSPPPVLFSAVWGCLSVSSVTSWTVRSSQTVTTSLWLIRTVGCVAGTPQLHRWISNMLIVKQGHMVTQKRKTEPSSKKGRSQETWGWEKCLSAVPLQSPPSPLDTCTLNGTRGGQPCLLQWTKNTHTHFYNQSLYIPYLISERCVSWSSPSSSQLNSSCRVYNPPPQRTG